MSRVTLLLKSIREEAKSDKAKLADLKNELVEVLNNETSIEIGFGMLVSEDMANLAAALEQNSSVTHLAISVNQINSEGFKALSDLLVNHPSLTSLELERITTDLAGIQALVPVLNDKSTLRNLAIRYSNFTLPGMQLLVNTLKNNTNLTAFEIGPSERGTVDDTLFKALKNNVTLRSLAIHQTARQEDIDALVILLKNNKCLTSLDLAECYLSNGTLEHFFNALKVHPTLANLNLKSNIRNMTQQAMESLIELVSSSSTLTNLCLDRSNLCLIDRSAMKGTEDVIVLLTRALENNSILSTFSFNQNHLSDKSATAFASMLEKNSTLTRLNLNGCGITDKGAYDLIQALDKNKTLRELGLDNYADENYFSSKLRSKTLMQLSTFLKEREAVIIQKTKEAISSSALPKVLVEIIAGYLGLKEEAAQSGSDRSKTPALLPAVPISGWQKITHWLRKTWSRVVNFIKNKLSPKKLSEQGDQNKIIPTPIPMILDPKVKVMKNDKIFSELLSGVISETDEPKKFQKFRDKI